MAENTLDAIVVLMTAGSREEAARLAEMLVGARLAACVQIMPEMESIYHWKGSIQRDPEFLLLAKTTRAKFEEAARLAEMLVGARLAACVQIMPEMESIYHRKGSIQRDPEFLLLAKTTRAKFEELEREVRALHSYE